MELSSWKTKTILIIPSEKAILFSVYSLLTMAVILLRRKNCDEMLLKSEDLEASRTELKVSETQILQLITSS